MGDVDDLLKELEGALKDTPAATSKATHSSAPTKLTVPPRLTAPSLSTGSGPSSRSITAKSDVDDLLAMIDGETAVSGQRGYGASGFVASSRSTDSSGTGAGAARSSKCTVVHIAPAKTAGYDVGAPRPGGAKRACSNLLCTACDFSVLRFEDKVWSDSVDYMFFRNHMPSVPRLSAELLAQAGSAAYCCQCSWVSVLGTDGLVVIRKAGGAPTLLSTLEHGSVGGNGWNAWSCAGHTN